jgi:hypothetical protein
MNYGQKNSAYGVLGLGATNVINSPALLGVGINANQIADGSVSNASFQYLSGATSNLQTQINNIAAGIVNFQAEAAATGNVLLANPGTDTFDTITLVTGDILFLGFQTAPEDNGLYVFDTSSTPLVRASNMNTWQEVVGARIYITAGSLYNGASFINTNQLGGTLGVTAITYIQGTSSYTAGTGVTITGNVISIGQSVATSANVTFATAAVSAATNFLVAGTTNTMTFTMAAQTASHAVTFPNADSNTVIPSSAGANQFATAISSGGVVSYAAASLAGLSDAAITTPSDAQVLLYVNGTSKWTNASFSGGFTVTNAGVATLSNSAVTGQALTGLSIAQGVVSSSDTILSSIGKLAANTITPVSTVSGAYSMTNTTLVVMQDTNASTITLPASGTVLPGRVYIIKLLGVAGGTVAAGGTDTLDGTVNGTFTITGQYNSMSAFSDGAGNWYSC